MMVEPSALLTSALSKQNQEQKEQAFTSLASLITRSLAAASGKEKTAREGLSINTANHLTGSRLLSKHSDHRERSECAWKYAGSMYRMDYRSTAMPRGTALEKWSQWLKTNKEKQGSSIK